MDDDRKNLMPNGIETPVGEDGVDVSLIRWALTLTPLERLQALEDLTNDLLGLHDAYQKH